MVVNVTLLFKVTPYNLTPVSMVTAFLSQTLFMMIAAYMHNAIGSVACITIAVGFGGFAWAGFAVNHLDIAPQVGLSLLLRWVFHCSSGGSFVVDISRHIHIPDKHISDSWRITLVVITRWLSIDRWQSSVCCVPLNIY